MTFWVSRSALWRATSTAIGPRMHNEKGPSRRRQVSSRATKKHGPNKRKEIRSPGSFFENHASPNRAKVPRPEIYLHKVHLFRILELHSDGSWKRFWVLVISSKTMLLPTAPKFQDLKFTCIKWIYSRSWNCILTDPGTDSTIIITKSDSFLRSWVLGPGSFFENHASPNRAKVPRPEIYLHKVDLFRVLELHSDGSWNR